MLAVIINFLNFALHPFKVHGLLSSARTFAAREERTIEENNESIVLPISFFEIVSISWLFKVIETLYVVVFIKFGFFAFESIGEQSGLVRDIFRKEFESFHFIIIFWALTKVVLYPVFAYLYAKIWGVIIKFCMDIFGISMSAEAKQLAVQEVVGYSFVSNLFLIFPVFGDLIKTVSSFFYLFSGLKSNLKMSNTQSVLVLLAPFIFISTLSLFFIMWLALVITSITGL
ncbi:MAG: hypothetical protein A2504_14530 [Bdellovibrionales bacterium RIFOXYD12_FULL_39_22]|nr:MAG: hypothetical protein A2385_04015 [Bdellovibrionales bacterium RIFOXYB1_FULL_39_21]OFZ43496.1 MAG: hypothetical protein A2485_13480 [Bdellovibrionales bacterium RIFOXYC12_FULL_39_17]OFZ48969.1 MAG: hypothetical protein A2404_08670 [Bdellovibrionales bacterium RIFOXYC1_FULL_39_130]OFZ73368.1 MAG: hypothetical protein A2451_04500 [Bdellovibrionales bacterium RIFOXYC2_FULL_39_8]OFZ76236.1 MAG: hypothetical protein A2560_07790 [Bdellovibrionales bacterium RIFOXYD1_FULL_39_84]OFZ94471.1 MAG: